MWNGVAALIKLMSVKYPTKNRKPDTAARFLKNSDVSNAVYSNTVTTNTGDGQTESKEGSFVVLMQQVRHTCFKNWEFFFFPGIRTLKCKTKAFDHTLVAFTFILATTALKGFSQTNTPSVHS